MKGRDWPQVATGAALATVVVVALYEGKAYLGQSDASPEREAAVTDSRASAPPVPDRSIGRAELPLMGSTVQRKFKAAFEAQVARTKALVNKLQTDPQTHLDGIYDVQTRHGVNPAAQTVWNERFARMKSSNANFALALALAGVH